MKIIFFDTETTGLDAKVNGIHQLAGDIVINDKVVDRFNYKIKPFKGCVVESEALAISKTNEKHFVSYWREDSTYFDLQRKLEKHLDYHHKADKFYLAGWRVPEFDNKFLQAFFDRNAYSGDVFKSYFWSNPIDVKVLATQYLIEKRPEMESFSLAPVAKYLGIKVVNSQLHKASYDAYLSRKVYEKLPKVTLGIK